MRENSRNPRATGFSLLFLAVLPGLAAAQPKLPQAPNLTPNTLTVSKTGSGTGFVRSVQVGPTGLEPGIDCGTKCSNSYSPVVLVKLRATPATGVFVGWSGDCSGTGACEVAMTSSRNVSARFEMPTVEVVKYGDLTAAVVRGDYAGPGGQIDCGQKCKMQVPFGTMLRFSASGLRAGYVMSAAGYESEVNELMRGASKAKYLVKLGAEPSVKIAVSNPRMTVTSAPPGLQTSGAGTFRYPFAAGTSVTLTNEYANAIWLCKSARSTGVLCEGRGLACTFTVPPDTLVGCTVRLP